MSICQVSKYIKLAVLAAAVITVSLSRVRVSASQSQEPTNIVAYGSTIAEKLGNYQDASLIIHFTGDIHGNLDVCTCKGRLLGGMARRVSFSKLFQEKYKDVPTLLVDSGGFLMDRTGEHGYLRNFSTVRDRWTIQGYERYGYSVANVSKHELPYLSGLTMAGQGLPEYPGRPRLSLVSANVIDNQNSAPKFDIHPYLVLNAQPANTASEKKPIRVAVIGLSDSPDDADDAEVMPSAFRVTDPINAARKLVPEARSKADVVAVLAHLNTAKAIELARTVPGIDVVIVGNEQEFTRPLRVNKTLLVFTPYETHSIGEVRFYSSPEGGFTSQDRYISLDTAIADDPEATKFVSDMLDEVKESTKKFSSGGFGQSPPVQSSAANIPSSFVGSAQCATCHAAQYMNWLNSPHAHATTSLAPKSDELEAGCFVCHATGFGKGGFAEGAAAMKFSNVQCEQCHGPAQEHIAKTDKSYGRISNLSAACSACHNSQTSPKFDAKAAWELIKH